MLSASLHVEDIKATLRKRHGTLAKFADARDIKAQALADWMRGRTSAPVAAAVEAELQAAKADEAVESMKLDDSGSSSPLHRLNAGGR
jgi:hypothetical protein